ncbi:ZYRO0F15554p [Zygosaccharomyces rouxii]|uniref:Mediator of RNA polymerase II transcription subunit 16 n=1 Tax=Zygosaccharomyces rouxii (strain ATCC 2623 / CBS 732 / NBRC 1130 / NCYC 568 / NRRL Y-229) TaxID=559307 RepID=C5DYT2_ZYGRC|nr:uncharacterized protein ZYRO0F15554g [Zygosaccharomyces rouxii]KAH9199699.1 mediator complex, subunit Med16 [Zygosaccharomyces rouxii]CAR28943.1 ZYRO0F15554p [Zygosaccharomyces rouxii]
MNSIGQDLVSWSKTGLIAYGDSKSPEGNLCITFLETINGTNWRFHPVQRYIIHPQLHENGAVNGLGSNSGHTSGNGVRHGSVSGQTPSLTSGGNSDKHSHGFFYNVSSVHWNNWFSLPGDMLAVCDELGNMTMLISGQSPEGPSTIEKLTMLFQDNVYKIHNQLVPLRPTTVMTTTPSSTSSSSLGKMERKQTKKEYHTTILNFHWLSSSKPVICSQFCVFDVSSNTHRNKAQQIPPFGVFHPPFMKYACMAVRKNGQIDFWYQFSNSKDHKKITLQLQNSQNQRTKELDWLKCAKITPINDDQCMLISTYSKYFKRLSFYKLHINWNVNATTPTTLNDPSLKISHILDVVPDALDDEGRVLELAHLHVLSKSSVEKNPYPEILLVYNVFGTKNSLLKRFRLVQTQLGPDFVNILKSASFSSDSGSSTNQPLRSKHFSLLQTGSITFPNRVISMTSEMLDGLASFYFQDGSIVTYNQNDWKPESERLQNQSKQGKFRDMITSVLSAGLQFPKVPPSAAIEWLRISPSMGGVIVKLAKKNNPRFYAIQDKDYNDVNSDASNATTLAFGFVASTHRQLSSEDLSIACKTHVVRLTQLDEERARNFITTLISCIYSFFNVTPDAPKEIMDKMISSRPIQKTMLLQLELGCTFTKSNVYEMARVIMSLRNVLFAFNGVSRNLHFAVEQLSNSSLQQSNSKAFQTSFSKQDLVHSLIPIAKWFVKFVTYLIQEVILLINDPQDKSNTLVLGVFGARMPRTLILSILNEIKKVTQIVTKFPETSYPVLNESSKFLKMVLGESPVNFEKFETFLVDVNNKFSAFNEQQPSTLREPSLLVKAEIPSDVHKMGDFLLAYSNNAVISHVNATSVYFTDTSELRISHGEFFNPQLLKLLQPIDEGLVVDTDELPDDLKSSRSFCQVKFDTISFDHFTPEELSDGKLKRCCRCGCVTRAGYIISPNKTIVPTSIQTKRWPTMYTRICICSGFLYELND